MTEIEALAEALPRLPIKDQAFATSLLQQAGRRGLSEKQMFWVRKLTQNANTPQAKRPKVEIGNFAGIMAIFAKAAQHLKHPSVLLPLPNKSYIDIIELKPTGAKSRYPGCIHVTDGGKYGSNVYCGRLTPSGDFIAARACEGREDVLATLKRFAENPAEVATEYGRLTGSCCFCRKDLTDERSTEVGYGPVCADHFGLPWGNKRKPTQAEVTVEVAKSLLEDKQLRTDLFEIARRLEGGAR